MFSTIISFFRTIIGYVITAGISFIIGSVGYFLLSTRKHFKNEKNVIDTANTAIDIADNVNTILSPLVPQPYTDIVDKILGYAKTSVTGAEQKYQAGLIKPEERKTQATSYVNNALTLNGITLTPEMKDVIEHAIESAVKDLPHISQSDIPKK